MSPCRRRDHPRSRGEYECGGHLLGTCFGSSPLSRGIRLRQGLPGPAGGIIPALAGNTTACQPGLGYPGDHPRSRGEYQPGLIRGLFGGGSSPLSRGIPGRETCEWCLMRIIPALAGNTWRDVSNAPCWRDHPRSRGEYVTGFVTYIGGAGSSPLSRGIRHPPRRYARHQRIIPALAGNTTASPPTCGPPRDHPRSRGEYTC